MFGNCEMPEQFQARDESADRELERRRKARDARMAELLAQFKVARADAKERKCTNE